MDDANSQWNVGWYTHLPHQDAATASFDIDGSVGRVFIYRTTYLGTVYGAQ